jgi:hypothetical protein
MYMKYFNLQNWGALTLFVILGAMIYIAPSRTVEDAELRYIEKSANRSLVGGIMPASCMSYADAIAAGHGPEYYTQHASDDTNGHCAGTCPSTLVDKLIKYNKCLYKSTVDLSETSYVIANPFTCPNVAPWDSDSTLINANPNYEVRVCSPPEANACLAIGGSGCSCTNGALNTSAPNCNVCPNGKIYNSTTNTCTPCGYAGCSGTPARCINGSQNTPSCYSNCRTGTVWFNGECLSTDSPDYCGSNTGKPCL